jgi:uncharacterized protein YdiU (UPF0061 family)
MASLQFEFDHWYIDDLPGDPDDRVIPRQVAGAAYSSVDPEPTAAPTLIAHSAEMAETLGISSDVVHSDQFARVFSGNELVDGMKPFAANYGGHQFGNWAGQLGDGRAISLGEVITTDGGHQQLQLKGAGPTPYSRRADGRAVLRSSIREFLCSEAMHHLGVPTTRALSLTLTGDHVVRDMLYDGNPAPEPGAVVCRVAPSFVRFGSFELPASRGDVELLTQFVEHTMRRFFPHHVPTDGVIGPDAIAAWFREVVERTADLMVDWMRVGFVHGVMNTDNLSILGLTIDYGPYGWLEDFDPGWTPNTTDAGGKRYRYGHQPQIGLWNLARLGNALMVLLDGPEPLQEALDSYGERFTSGWQRALSAKLGLTDVNPKVATALSDRLLELLPRTETDMTIFFRTLGDIDVTAGVDDAMARLTAAYYRPHELQGDLLAATTTWLDDYLAISSGADPDARRVAMHAVNPKYVLRNYLAQMAIDKSELGDHQLIGDLLELLRRPYDEQPGKEEFAEKRPDWARTRVGCSMLSCSS